MDDGATCTIMTHFETLEDPRMERAKQHLLVDIIAERRAGTEVSRETRYYISSLAASARTLHDAVRSHWGIENKVHWVLDLAFREDESRARSGHSAHNMAVLRHIALNLLRHETTARCGIKARRLKAGWDLPYLLKVLAG